MLSPSFLSFCIGGRLNKFPPPLKQKKHTSVDQKSSHHVENEEREREGGRPLRLRQRKGMNEAFLWRIFEGLGESI